LPSNNQLNLPSNIAKKLLNNPGECKFNSYLKIAVKMTFTFEVQT